MKTHPTLSAAVALGISLLASGFALAESTPSPPDRSAKRLKFTSKIHIPVKPATEVTALPPVGYTLVFEDEFNGDQIDTQKWGFRLEDKMLSAQQKENVSVKDGNLEIALRKESVAGKSYTAGGIISRQTFVYGYYEARFKTPPAEGWHTSFWAMNHRFPGDPPGPRTLLELDFCEQDGGDPHYFSFGVINQFPRQKETPILECRALGHRRRPGHVGGFSCVVLRVHARNHSFLLRRETDQRVVFRRVSPRSHERLVQRDREHLEGRSLGR